MSSRRTQQATVHRSAAWRSAAESHLPESAVRIKQAPLHNKETEAAIQASLSAALEELDQLELGEMRPKPVAKMNIPRGMPPLPGGRAMPPLPLARLLSLRPRLSRAPKPSAPPKPLSVPISPANQAELSSSPPARWPGIVAAVLGLLLVGAAIWLSIVR